MRAFDSRTVCLKSCLCVFNEYPSTCIVTLDNNIIVNSILRNKLMFSNFLSFVRKKGDIVQAVNICFIQQWLKNSHKRNSRQTYSVDKMQIKHLTYIKTSLSFFPRNHMLNNKLKNNSGMHVYRIKILIWFLLY